MRYLLSAVLTLMAPAAASADSMCPHLPGTNSLQAYVALGSTGCTIGDFSFSSFTYTYNLTDNQDPNIAGKGIPAGFGQPIADTAVTVTPFESDGTSGLEIGNASWQVSGWQSAVLDISFNVAMVSDKLEGIRADFTGSAGGGASATFLASAQSPDGAKNILSNETGIYLFPTPLDSVSVLLQANLTGNTSPACGDFCTLNPVFYTQLDSIFGRQAHLSNIRLVFSETTNFDPPPTTVPEPASWLTLLSALGITGLVKRRVGRRSTF